MSFLKTNGQSIPCGGTTTLSAIESITPNCTYTSAAYTNSYALQSYYVPSSSSPLITVKVVLHVFTDNSGNGLWENTSSTSNGVPALYTLFSALENNTDRYSDTRIATYTVTGFSPTYIYDSQTRYELTKVYFYPDNTLYSTNPYYNPSAFYTYFNTNYPTRLDEGLPIIMNGTCTAHQNVGPNGTPLVFTTFGPGNNSFVQSHLRHEIGHCFGLLHCYYGCPYSPAPENIDCVNNPDFLSDVFPTNNPHCNPVYNATCFPNPASSPCFLCHEDDQPSPYINIRSNNLMDNQGTNTWMSPLQMARRRRCMYLSPIRMYAKDSTSDHVNVRNITSSQTWDFDIQMYEDIVVKAGNTLTVKCKIAMPIDGKIKVERGAKLLIDGGEITGWCKTGLWKGIEVEGDATQNQNYSGGYALYQGICESINSATISNAQNAICTYTTNTSGVMDANSTGGIVIGNTTNFINNVRSVEFYYYYSPNGGNKSMFTKCNFKTASLIPTGATPSHHVTLYNVDGVRFLGCNFEYGAGSAYSIGNRGNGIYSIDAQYSVDHVCNDASSPCSGGFTKTEFKNLENGVYVDNTNSLRVVSIKNTDFYDNLNYSTYYNTITTPVFEYNYVRTYSSSGSAVGLYLNNCTLYNVNNNTFLRNTSLITGGDVGIYANNSQSGAHKIYRNSFAGFNVGIGTIDNNSGVSNNTDGLKMNCNDFTPIANNYDIAVMGTYSPTVMKDQGLSSPVTKLVRNIYAAASTGSSDENKWYIEGTSVKTINHPANSDANMRPTPQPANSDVNLNVTNSGAAYTPSNCPETESTGGGGGGARLANINNNINSLASQNTMVNAKGVDQAETNVSFELQATLAEKLNYFLTDTLSQSKDSVIALLQNYPNAIDNADVLLTYAYINRGDFIKAQQNVTVLATKKVDWANLQAKLIELYQSPKHLFDLNANASAKNLLENYAATEGKDGRGAAQSILKLVNGQNYFVPHLIPLVEGGVKKSINNPVTENENKLANAAFNLYPNPANTMVNFTYKGSNENIHITLSNTLGTIVYQAEAKPNSKTEISLNSFETGVYLLTAYNGKLKVYQSKVMCIK